MSGRARRTLLLAAVVAVVAVVALIPSSLSAQTVTEPVITNINLERELRFTASIIVPAGWHFTALQLAAGTRPTEDSWTNAAGTLRPGAFSSDTSMIPGVNNWFRLVVEADDASSAHRAAHPCTGTVDPRSPSRCYSKPSYYRPPVRVVTATPGMAALPPRTVSRLGLQWSEG